MRHAVVAVVAVCGLVGCGGGGGGGGTPPAPDATPDAFSFADRSNAVRGAVVSATASIAGINTSSVIGIVGGEYSIGGAAYTNSAGVVTNGAAVSVRVTASTTPGGTVEAVLTVGGIAGTFRVTTSTDVTPPTATIIFPPSVARTGGSAIVVRGAAADASGPLAAVRVNGVLATTTNGFTTWTAQVPLAPGANTLAVTAEDGFLNVANAAAHATVRRNAHLGSPLSMALDAANGRAFVVDGSADAVVAVDLTTGIRSWFSDTAVPGFGRQATLPMSIVHDAARNRLLVLDSYEEAIVAIDMTTKARTVLSGRSTSSANRFEGPGDFVLDSARNRLLVTSTSPPRIIAVDLVSGARTVLSDATTPNSANMFTSPLAIAIDAAHGRALVGDQSSLSTIYAVSLTDGARTLLTSMTVPNDDEPWFDYNAMDVDAARNRVLVPQINGQVVAVDLDSGQRTMFSVGQGGEFITSPTDIAVDSGKNRAIVLDYQGHRLAAVDLGDGTQSGLSPNNVASGGVGLVEPFGVALDLRNARMLVSDIGLRSVVSLDLATAIGTVAVDGDSGTVRFGRPRALELDSAANRLFVLDWSGYLPTAIIAVNLVTGDRSILTGPTQPNAVLPLTAPQQMALDAQGMRLLVTERDERLLKAVDTAAGARTIVSSDAVPNAAYPFAEAQGVILDLANGRAFVANSRLGPGSEILAVNLSNGQRAPVAVNSPGQLTGPKLLALDAARNRLLVVDELRDTIFGIDLGSGMIGSLTDVEDPDNPIDSPNGIAYDPATQIAYVSEWNFAAILAVDLVTGRRVFVSH